ncbi:MAG TPA: sulfite exporter TauE/SafE family protein [Longimicrobium sp.]|jgi:hypothetical protein
MDWRATLAGLLVGGLIGMTGMGGGSVMTPLLIVGLGVPPLQAVASGLVNAAVTTAVGGWEHVRLRTSDLGAVARLAAGSVPAAVVAVFLFSRLGLSTPALEQSVKHAVGIVLMLLASALLVRGRLGDGRAPAPRRVPGWLLSGGGAVVGATAGITSIGSGSLTTAFLSTAARADGPRLVGTVIVHTALLTFAAGLAHLAVGAVDPALTLSLLAGSVPGVVIGSRVTLRVPERVLREALASVLLILGVLTFASRPSAERGVAEAADPGPAAVQPPAAAPGDAG